MSMTLAHVVSSLRGGLPRKMTVRSFNPAQSSDLLFTSAIGGRQALGRIASIRLCGFVGGVVVVTNSATPDALRDQNPVTYWGAKAYVFSDPVRAGLTSVLRRISELEPFDETALRGLAAAASAPKLWLDRHVLPLLEECCHAAPSDRRLHDCLALELALLRRKSSCAMHQHPNPLLVMQAEACFHRDHQERSASVRPTSQIQLLMDALWLELRSATMPARRALLTSLLRDALSQWVTEVTLHQEFVAFLEEDNEQGTDT